MLNNNILYKIDNLKHSYKNKCVLNVPDLSIEKGSSIGFIGSNGSGKSTLLRILAFLEFPDRGNVFFNNDKIDRNNSNCRDNVTLLLQESYLLKRSVFENVAYGLRAKGKKNNIKEKVFEALGLVGLSPEKFSKRKWFELSGGEAQRVALASRLILKPEVLILDEPTASIDKESANIIKDTINNFRTMFNTSLIIASHDLVWLNSMSDNILRLYEGRVVGTGSENLIEGPWKYLEDGLWRKKLFNGQRICATEPPHEQAVAILNPSDIIISVQSPEGISAQNILTGKIINMTTANDANKVKLELDAFGITLNCLVTSHAVNTLQLIPGKEIWAVFKASSIRWQ